MKAYLDNNIYAFLFERRQQDALKDLVREQSLAIVGSGENLSETLRAPDDEMRRERLRFLASTVTVHAPPCAYLHAKELIAEVKRCRPEWLQPRPDTSRISVWLNLSKRMWALAKSNPSELSAINMEPYKRDFEYSVALLKTDQKERRDFLRKTNEFSESIHIGVPTSQGQLSLDHTQDNYCRTHLMAVWHAALFQRRPQSRDYRDYAGPYLVDSIPWDDWTKFWIEEVDAKALPRGYISASVEFYQSEHKPGHGNAADSLHANHILDSDIFLTADRSFYVILSYLREQVPNCAKLGFVDRAEQNAVFAIRQAIAQAI